MPNRNRGVEDFLYRWNTPYEPFNPNYQQQVNQTAPQIPNTTQGGGSYGTPPPSPEVEPIPPSPWGGVANAAVQVGDIATNVIDTVGGVRKSLIQGGLAILPNLIEDRHNERETSPIMAYNRDPYGQQQFNNMFEQGGRVNKAQEYLSKNKGKLNNKATKFLEFIAEQQPPTQNPFNKMQEGGEVNKNMYMGVMLDTPETFERPGTRYTAPLPPIEPYQPTSWVRNEDNSYTINTQTENARRLSQITNRGYDVGTRGRLGANNQTGNHLQELRDFSSSSPQQYKTTMNNQHTRVGRALRSIFKYQDGGEVVPYESPLLAEEVEEQVIEGEEGQEDIDLQIQAAIEFLKSQGYDIDIQE